MIKADVSEIINTLLMESYIRKYYGDVMAEDNKNYEIKVEIYDMEFWKNGFTYDNIEFIPYEDCTERYKMIKDEKIHCPTGNVKISLSAGTYKEAVDKAKPLISNYEKLLTFAQGHYVFSHDYKCYEVENGKRHKVNGLFFSVVGVDTPPGVSIIDPAGIEEFIKKAMPLINDKEYVEKTGIDRAITDFIFGNPWDIETPALWFPIKWMVLEMLANAHAKSIGKEFIFSDTRFLILENKFEALIKNDLLLFSIGRELEEELNRGIVPEGLKKKMVDREGVLFSNNISIKKENDGKWAIIDEEKKNTYIVRKEMEKLNIYLKLNNKERKKLKPNLHDINRRPIEHKIRVLLKEYELEQYNPEIKKLKNFRDDVIHGNLLSYDFDEKINFEIKILRILEKTILSMLHSYDNNFIRPAIRKDSLLAIPGV